MPLKHCFVMYVIVDKYISSFYSHNSNFLLWNYFFVSFHPIMFFFSCSVLIQTSCPAFCLQTCCLSTDSFHLLTRFIYHFRRFSIEISSISFLKEKRIEKKNAKIKEFLTFFFRLVTAFYSWRNVPILDFSFVLFF